MSQSSAGEHGKVGRRRRMKYVIALGSNLGDRVEWIERALREMEAVDIRILSTSSLWQTPPMYVEDQNDFVNGACVVSTELQPISLMLQLQDIEKKLGRVKVVDKGPRNIDLDIILWEHGQFESQEPDLTIPHRLVEERAFVVLPVSQLLASGTIFNYAPPLQSEGQTDESPSARYARIARELWQPPRSRPRTVDSSTATSQAIIQPCTMLSPNLPPLLSQNPTKPTQIMSILNLTPDSFSDGGIHVSQNTDYLRDTMLSHLHAGATIIDVGGQSSRPGAPDITAEEEIARVTPALEVLSSLRSERLSLPFAVSIDTYRAAVAERAVQLGADIINDVSAGTLDKDMLPTVARLGCTYIMMHMRGTPHTMTSEGNTTYSDKDVVGGVLSELEDRVKTAIAAGVRRWRIVLDPGVGFAKTATQNLELLRQLNNMTLFNSPSAHVGGALYGMPWLVGTSRKGFIGKVTGVTDAKDRVWGTSATVAAAVAGGADIVRVHDVKEMRQVVKMSDAIWRGS